jgi:hypothetical protein
MSRQAYQLWLTVWILCLAGYGSLLIIARATAWLSLSLLLLGLFATTQCCRWHWRRHREYVSAKCNARAAADHARRHYL